MSETKQLNITMQMSISSEETTEEKDDETVKEE